MKHIFRKMIRNQIQEDFNNPKELMKKQPPSGGWIKAIRSALGLSARQLAIRLKCSRANITALERREKNGTITLRVLDDVAQAMNCRLVYFLVPHKPFEELLEEQALKVIKKQLRSVSHSMALEQQALTPQQQKQQEIDLAQDMIRNNISKLWD